MMLSLLWSIVFEVDQFLLVMFDSLVTIFVDLHHIDNFDFLIRIIVPKFLIKQKKINEINKNE